MKKNCIIVDIDGTLANNKHRSPYDMEQIHNDLPITATCKIVERAYENVDVILVSGRSEKYKNETVKRLHSFGVAYTYLFMRPANDTRPDTEIKKEIYEMNIKGIYNVLFAIDDRTRIVDQRREMGIYTLDCNQTREVF